jgi:hypothetical protein
MMAEAPVVTAMVTLPPVVRRGLNCVGPGFDRQFIQLVAASVEFLLELIFDLMMESMCFLETCGVLIIIRYCNKDDSNSHFIYELNNTQHSVFFLVSGRLGVCS